jgi:hypothetical protein
MTDRQILLRLTEKCDIYFEDSLISKEFIIQEYADFFANSIASNEHSSSVVLHTGSVCFDIVSFITVALACVSMDETDVDDIIASFLEGDMVLFKNERYRWLGVETIEGQLYLRIEQDGRGKNGKMILSCPYETSKGFIKPYNGTSVVTDGRGIRKKKLNRADFISYITGKEISEIPAITGVSAVVVADRTSFDRIQKGLRIEYDGKSINLLDIVPASYYTDGDEPYQFGSNPSKAEPVLKIAGKVSVARDLVLDKRGNRAVGFMVIGSEVASKGSSELEDLLVRKSLKFTHISMSIDSENAEEYVGEKADSEIFACTKEFLLQHSKPTTVSNLFTDELDRQVDNIVNNEVRTVLINGVCFWKTYRNIRNALFLIRQSDWDEDRKKNFIIPAYSLLNLFTTAVFTMEDMELAVANNEIQNGVTSPYAKISELWKAAESSGSFEAQCVLVVDALDDLYKSILKDSPKYQALYELVKSSVGEKIAIIIPKAYYVDILKKEPLFSGKWIHIMTANRFDAAQSYDKVIVVGDFSGKRFNALKCRAAADIIVLLYECETHWFKRKKRKASEFEKKLNLISGLNDGFEEAENDDNDEDEDEDETVERFEGESLALEEYINTISVFDIRKFTAGITASGGNALMSEISAIGRFTDGERIMFSKYYKAVVYSPSNAKEPISETDVDKLMVSDRLVFTKRDDFTRNIVDSIFDALQTSSKLNNEVIDAAEKAQWWKEVLRDYQKSNSLSYRQLARKLNGFGCTVQEQGIRQWLVPDSHIVGPREEETLRQIAEMTEDSCLLNDVSGYFNACRTVRRQRKRILELIGKAIEEKLSGHQPPHGSELEIVYNNVESLSEILELEAITFLDEVISVPINLINKPIIDMEVIS